MMCSQEEPTGEFLDKLIPTGSASMKNAIEKIRKPLMQMLQVKILNRKVIFLTGDKLETDFYPIL